MVSEGALIYCTETLMRKSLTEYMTYLQSFGPVDPFQLVKEEIDSVSERLRRSIFTGIPTLRSAAQYFFKVCLAGSHGTTGCCFSTSGRHASHGMSFHTCHVSCRASLYEAAQQAWLHAHV